MSAEQQDRANSSQEVASSDDYEVLEPAFLQVNAASMQCLGKSTLQGYPGAE